MTNLVENSTNSQQNLEERNENNEQQMRTLQTKLCRAGTHTHTHANKERKLRGDLADRTEEGEEGNKNMRGVPRQRLRLL